MAKILLICTNLQENPWIIKGKPAENNFLDAKIIIKTANSKPANSEGRLYYNQYMLSIFIAEATKWWLWICSDDNEHVDHSRAMQTVKNNILSD